MNTYRRIYAQIHLDHMMDNIEQLRNHTGKQGQILVVVKADGYGHGAVPIAKVLDEREYVWGFGVATLEEAVQLQNRGIKKPVLVLGCIFPHQYEQMIQQRIRATVYTIEMAKHINAVAKRLGQQAYLHIKLDTGMGRLGFAPDEKSISLIQEINGFSELQLEGLFTHFAGADEEDLTVTREQLRKFYSIKEALCREGITFSQIHFANSAGSIRLREKAGNLIRLGIAMYGLLPDGALKKEGLSLKPVLELKSRVVMVKEVPENTPISYGGDFVTRKRTRIATIPVGYGDGYPRTLSNRGEVLLHGKRAPILGRVCMDQLMVDVTDIEGVAFEDEATLIGTDGKETITVEELSERSGRFHYELLCDLSKRIPRIYDRGGRQVDVMDYLE